VFPAERMKLVAEYLSASLGSDSYCALCLACVSLSDDHSDQRLLIIILSLWMYVDVSKYIS
jgi:hypothetical protein